MLRQDVGQLNLITLTCMSLTKFGGRKEVILK